MPFEPPIRRLLRSAILVVAFQQSYCVARSPLEAPARCEAASNCAEPGPCELADGSTCVGSLCVYASVPAGTTCDDADPCTLSDTCNGSGECTGIPRSCTALGTSSCLASSGTCDSSTGECVYPPLIGTACDDSDPCTSDDRCSSNGACEGTPLSCDNPPGVCLASGSCEPTTGACEYPPAPAGTVCDDGLSLTAGDVCDGAESCAGVLPAGWPRAISHTASVTPRGITLGANGEPSVVVDVTNTWNGAGYDGTLALDGITLGLTDRMNIVSAAFSEQASLRWVNTYGGPQVQTRRVIGGGSLPTYIAGLVVGTTTFDDTVITTGSRQEPLLVGVDEGGAITTLEHYGSGTWNSQAHAIDVRNGRIVLGGIYGDTVDFGNGVVLPQAEYEDCYFALFDMPSDGRPVARWATTFPGSDLCYSRAAVLRDDGSSVLAGTFLGTTDFGSANVTVSDRELWVAAYDANGNQQWLEFFGGPANDNIHSVFLDDNGDVIVTGDITGTVTVQGLSIVASGLGRDGFMLRFGVDGSVLSGWTLGGDGGDSIRGGLVRPDGVLYLHGAFDTSASLHGQGTITGAGGRDGVVLALDPSNNVLAYEVLGGPGDDGVEAIALDATARVLWVLGGFGSSIELNSVTLTSSTPAAFVHPLLFHPEL